MTLAFQCGEWDLDAFEEKLSARLMTRWEQWFARRPQGQHQSDQMIAQMAASLLQAKGADVRPPQFMVGYPAPDEKQSLEQQWQAARSNLKKKVRKQLPPKTEEPVSAERSGNATDCRQPTVHVGNF